MMQVLGEDNIQCNTCIKRDVCKFKEEYMQTFRNIQDDFHYPSDTFEVKLNCKKYISQVVMSTETYPWGVRGGTGDIAYLNNETLITSKGER